MKRVEQARRPRTWSSAYGARTSRSGAAPACPRSANRLGWLTISDKMLDHADELARVRRVGASADGFTDVALLGMGGSSLGPEVIRRSFGEIPGGLRLHVLDSTDPAAVLGARALARPGAHAVRRVVQVGRHDRDALAHALLPRAQRRRRQPLRGGHRPGQPAGGHGERARLPARVRERPEHRRALLGALLLRARAGRAGGRERGGAPGRRPGGGAELREQRRHERELGPLARAS